MEIHNEKAILRVQKTKLLLKVIFLPLIIGLILVMFFEKNLLVVNTSYWAILIIIMSLLYILIEVYYHNVDHNFIYYNDEEGKIIIRFYSTRMGSKKGKHKSIEITKGQLVKYTIEKKFFHRKKELVLFVRLPKGIAKYPAISITALDDRQVEQLKRGLMENIS
jgi:hypothetical protein